VSEGGSVDRWAQGLTPRFVRVEPPSAAAIAAVVETISHRVIRTLRRRRYLGAAIDAAVATGSDPLGEDEPELARTMAASVPQRLAVGERAGQKVRRIGAGFGGEGERPALTGPRCAVVHGVSLHANVAVPAHRRDPLPRLIRSTARGAVSLERLEADAGGDLLATFTRPWSDGTLGITLAPWERLEKLAARVPLPRMHLGRSGGCLAPPSQRRGALTPPPRQHGMAAPEARSASLRWGGARRLTRVLACAMEHCPAWGRGTLRLLAALTPGDVIHTMRRHRKRAPDPPPSAPAPVCHDRFAWAAPEQTALLPESPGRGRGAPAAGHAGRVWRPRARARRLTEQTGWGFGSEGWGLSPRQR
jgi:hypothetical protein